ncbi:MAG: RnfH family protein [Gammaproteobacteria bacterium]|jgi:putative ubiquitin-RnfH superfamily antitoxin RatB of RatAB toxin-antitoxin module
MEHADNITVEVAYALPDRQLILELSVAPGTTLGQAIQASGILERFPEIDLSRNKVGVFGKLGSLDTVLQGGDRAEIYRPLIADPKQVRKQRAARGKPTKKGGGR